MMRYQDKLATAHLIGIFVAGISFGILIGGILHYFFGYMWLIIIAAMFGSVIQTGIEFYVRRVKKKQLLTEDQSHIRL